MKRKEKNYHFLFSNWYLNNPIQLVVEADNYQTAAKEVRKIVGKNRVKYQFSTEII